MSGCSSGYIPFSLAAAPFLKVVGKTMFVKWKIKENMAKHYFRSRIANHDGASCINGIKSYWELLSMIYYHASLWKNIADFSTRNILLIVQTSLSWIQVSKLLMKSDIWVHSGQWILTWSNFRKLFLYTKFPSSSFQLKGKVQFHDFFKDLLCFRKIYLLLSRRI